MRAVRFDEYGDLDVIDVRDVATPTAEEGRVVVRVAATSVNPGETMIRTGLMAGDDDVFPMGEGSDLAGTVAEIGAGVTDWSVGDEVIGWSDQRSAHAEYVAVPAAQLTARPDGVDVDQAGSLYVAGGTAVAMRDAVSPTSGETVVVTAAAGGVGAILSQLLVHDGVRVLGVAGPDNDDYLRGIGVEPVNHGDGLEERIAAAAPEGVDAFLDCFGHGYVEQALRLAPKERIVTIADFGPAQEHGVTVVFGHAATTADTLSELARLIAAGDLTVPIAATFPLEETRAAYTRLADRRTRGKIVLHPQGD